MFILQRSFVFVDGNQILMETGKLRISVLCGDVEFLVNQTQE